MLKDICYKEIADAISAKREANKVPDLVLLRDIQKSMQNKVTDAIRELCKEGKVKFGKTINDIYLKIE